MNILRKQMKCNAIAYLHTTIPRYRVKRAVIIFNSANCDRLIYTENKSGLKSIFSDKRYHLSNLSKEIEKKSPIFHVKYNCTPHKKTPPIAPQKIDDIARSRVVSKNTGTSR
jgi:hypothetical protein